MKAIKSILFAGMLALGATLSGTSSVWAQCFSPTQVGLDEFENTLLRDILQDVVRDVERFFGLSLDGFCIDIEPVQAYFIHKDPDYDAMIVEEDFLFEMSNAPWNLNSLISIIAHEGAHGFQIKHKLLDTLGYTQGGYVKCVELHADFLAGGFMRWTADRYKVDPKHLSELFHSLGEHEYTKRDHHGAPGERYLAFMRGYNAPAPDEKTLATMGLMYVYNIDC